MSTLDSNKVTGVSLVSNATDAANKEYIDDLIPSTTGNAGKFLNASGETFPWYPVVGSTSVALNSNNLVYANSLSLYAYAANTSVATSTDAITWRLRTMNGAWSGASFITFGRSTGGIDYFLITSNTNSSSGFNIQASTDAITWQLRTTDAVMAQSRQSLIYGDGKYLSGVRTTSGGAIHGSTDTIHWSLRTTPGSIRVGPIIKYLNNIFITSGPTNQNFSTSTDSIIWTLRTTGYVFVDISSDIKDFSYFKNTYVATGVTGLILTSTNTIQWSLRTSGTTSDINRSTIDSRNKYIYAVGASGTTIISTDTITWAIRSSGFGTSTIGSIILGNNIILAGGDNGTMRMIPSYGRAWESINSTTTSPSIKAYKGSQEFTTSGAQTFYIPPTATQFYIEAIGAGGGGATASYTSLYSGGGGGSGAYNAWLIRRGELGNATTMTVTVGARGRSGDCRGMCKTTDGISWTHIQSGSGFGTSTILTLMYDGTNYFAGGAGGALTTSTDTIFWFQRTSGRTTQIGYATGGNGLLYAAGQTNPYVYAGASGVLASSTDSIVWTLRTSPNSTIAIQALAFGSLPTATYVRSTATAGEIATSTDAINWVLRTTGNTTNVIQSLLYSTATTEYYVNCRVSGALQTSTNAIQWTSRTSGTAQALRQLLYGAVYVVAGDSGVLNTSTNAIEWTLRTAGTGQSLYGLAYNASATEKYLAAGSGGVVLSSTDAITWSLRTSLFAAAPIVHTLTYGSTFVAAGVVGDSGGASGGSTTVSWTGNTPTSTTTYTLTSAGGGGGSSSGVTAGTAAAAAASTLNPLYATAGLAGGAGRSAPGASNDSTQANSNQVTGGGGGAFGTFTGGSATTYYYGNTYTNGGSASGGNASDGIPGSYTGNIGGGGGGGGALSEGVYSWSIRTAPGVSFNGSFPSAATSGNSLYVVSLGTGSIITSTNTIAWTIRTNPGTPSSFVFANSTFVGSGGAKISSTDGIVWVIRTSPAGVGGALGFGNNFYLAGGASTSSLEISTDAIVWELRTSGFGSSTISAVTFGNSTYVIAGGAALATSTDTINWTLRTSSATAGNITSLSFGDNTFLCTSFGPSAQILSSTNAIQWTLRTVGTANVKYIRVSTYGNGYFSIGGVDDSFNTQVFNMSTNAIVWEKPSVPSATGFNDSRVDYRAVSNTGDYYILGGVRHLSTASTTSQSAVGNGGNGTRGGGGGGGGFSIQQNRFGIGGPGGDGYVRITWW